MVGTMESLVDGMLDGVKEWKNVQHIVRQMFEALVGEVRTLQKERATYQHLLSRVNVMESRVDGLSNATRSFRDVHDKLARIDASLGQSANNAALAHTVSLKTRDVLDSAVKKMNALPTLDDVHSLIREAEQRLEDHPLSDHHDAFRPVSPTVDGLLRGPRSTLPYEVRAPSTCLLDSSSPLPSATWSCKGSTLKLHRGSIEWTCRQGLSGDQRCFEWCTPVPHVVKTLPEGVYEVSAGVFSTEAPKLSLLVNGDEVLVSRTCRSYIVTNSRKGCSEDSHCAKRCITGHTMHDYLWLPCQATIAVKLQQDSTVPSVRIRDAILTLKYMR
ncbi:hypothetical protein DIPPA_25236 [Diplonema papillatum]|nr:hypothetical protein DIPPA_25236 [Diplonema papillatum]